MAHAVSIMIETTRRPTALRSTWVGMAHKIAKLMLEHADTFLERAEAIRLAVSLGMPLHEVEEYLDWLDATRGPLPDSPDDESPDGN